MERGIHYWIFDWIIIDNISVWSSDNMRLGHKEKMMMKALGIEEIKVKRALIEFEDGNHMELINPKAQKVKHADNKNKVAYNLQER